MLVKLMIGRGAHGIFFILEMAGQVGFYFIQKADYPFFCFIAARCLNAILNKAEQLFMLDIHKLDAGLEFLVPHCRVRIHVAVESSK